MNKIPEGIHIGKYNAFTHKCAALTAGVHSKAATLCLTHNIKHHTALVYVQYAQTVLINRIYWHKANRELGYWNLMLRLCGSIFHHFYAKRWRCVSKRWRDPLTFLLVRLSGKNLPLIWSPWQGSLKTSFHKISVNMCGLQGVMMLMIFVTPWTFFDCHYLTNIFPCIQ